MPVDLNAWLREIAADGSLSESEIESLRPILGKEKVLTKLDSQILMRGDYTRKTQELADERRKLTGEVAAEREKLETWRTGVVGQLDKAYKDLQDERTTRAQFESRIRTIAERNGLDPKELLAGSESAHREVDDATRHDGKSAGLSEADLDRLLEPRLQRYLGDSRVIAGAVDVEVGDIADEHRELFGKRLNRSELYQKTVEINRERLKAGQPGVSIRQVWEADNKVPEKREEIKRAEMRKEIEKDVEEKQRAKLSESLLDGNNRSQLPDDRRSPIFAKQDRERAAAAKDTKAGKGDQNGDRRQQQDDNSTQHERLEPSRSAAENEGRWQKAAMTFRDRRAQGIPLGHEAPSDRANSEA